MIPIFRSAVSLLFLIPSPAPARTVATSSGQETENVPVVVSTAWLASHLRDENVIVVAVDMQRAAYDSAHIPGARFLPYGAFTERRNGLVTELPPLATLDSALEAVGISDRSRVVIYGPAVVSHRLFMTLDVTGLRGRVGMLDGGLEAWRAAGGAVTAAPPSVRVGALTLRPVPGAMVDRTWVRAHLADPGFQFIDGRMRSRFDSAHLPGAVSAPFASLLASGRTRGAWSLLPRDSLDTALSTAGVDHAREAVAYCAIGETASVVYFVLRSLGRSVRLYDGSMEDWTADPSAPIERGPRVP